MKTQAQNRNLVNVSAGLVLLSSPLIADKSLQKSVVIITRVYRDVILGLTLNKPVRVDPKYRFNKREAYRFPLFDGGPVQHDNVSYLLGVDDREHHSSDALLWSSDSSTLEHVLKFKRYSSFTFLHFYSGFVLWPAKQLLDELGRNEWLTVAGNTAELLSVPDAINWESLLLEYSPYSAPLLEIDRETVYN